jgi:hypothetical protein
MNNIEPLVGVGTILPAKKGTVVSINCDSVTVKKNDKESTLDFSQVEQLYFKE